MTMLYLLHFENIFLYVCKYNSSLLGHWAEGEEEEEKEKKEGASILNRR